MPKPKHNIAPDRLALYEKLVAINPKVERKGAANPYSSQKRSSRNTVRPCLRRTVR